MRAPDKEDATEGPTNMFTEFGEIWIFALARELELALAERFVSLSEYCAQFVEPLFLRKIVGRIAPAVSPFVIAEEVDQPLLEALKLFVHRLEDGLRAESGAILDVAVMHREGDIGVVDLLNHVWKTDLLIVVGVGNVADQRERDRLREVGVLLLRGRRATDKEQTAG